MMLRIMKDSDLKLVYIPKTLVYMRSGGVSTAGLKGYYRSFKESLLVLKKNKINMPPFVNIIRTFRILLQVISAKLSK